MNARRLDADGKRTDILVFESGEEVVGTLTRFVREQGILAGSFMAIGAFQRATVQFFDWETKKYLDNPFEEQLEVLSLLGDITRDDGDPAVHAHVVLGRRNGVAVGGHLKEAIVRPTLELVIEQVPVHLRKRYDKASGLTLIDVRAYVQ